jgi:hypothetical protein
MIRQDTKYSYAFLDTSEAQNSRSIALLKKVWVVITNGLHDPQKQGPLHLIPTSKNPLLVYVGVFEK